MIQRNNLFEQLQTLVINSNIEYIAIPWPTGTDADSWLSYAKDNYEGVKAGLFSLGIEFDVDDETGLKTILEDIYWHLCILHSYLAMIREALHGITVGYGKFHPQLPEILDIDLTELSQMAIVYAGSIAFFTNGMMDDKLCKKIITLQFVLCEIQKRCLWLSNDNELLRQEFNKMKRSWPMSVDRFGGKQNERVLSSEDIAALKDLFLASNESTKDKASGALSSICDKLRIPTDEILSS
jgi:hypothetical protein